MIVPLFALANAGIQVSWNLLSNAVDSPITLGIAGRLLVGKPVGISIGSWLASRPRPARAALADQRTGAGAGGAVRRDRLHGLAADLEPRVQGRATRRGEARRAGDGRRWHRLAAWVVTRLDQTAAGRATRAPDRAHRRRHPRSLRGRRPCARPHSRSRRRAGDAARVRRLRVPLLRSGRAGDPRAAVSLGTDVRYVWRHLPLNDVHPQRPARAEAAEAAAAQGKFWEMHDTLLSPPGRRCRRSDLAGYAEQLGLDIDRFLDELRRREYAPRVSAGRRKRR